MTTNAAIASILNLTATLLELHEENVFKIKALQSAAVVVENSNQTLAELPLEQLVLIDGLGKSIAAKIGEITITGTTQELDELLKSTPKGVVEMLNIKGIGAKKVRTIWKELKVETLTALQLACERNEVAALKGFGEKTQETIKQNIEFTQAYAHYLRYDQAEAVGEILLTVLNKIKAISQVQITGEIARKLEVIHSIQLVVATEENVQIIIEEINTIDFLQPTSKLSGPYVWRGVTIETQTPVEIKFTTNALFQSTVYLNTAADAHLATPLAHGKTIFQSLYKLEAENENQLFEILRYPYIAPELREGIIEFELLAAKPDLQLLTTADLRGALHNHSTYSDGAYSVAEMAQRCIDLGLEYFGIADHSKSGNFYNNGMYENKVQQQQKEIDELNKKLAPFHIFKGIEVDILSDGALDYDDEVMASFDYVVASIHTNLKMDITKATARTIKAIEHPSTTILGHATGRLLLKREGFPLDYRKVIDACAANEVGIEINANPRRLDLDWRQVIYALEKGILISINPDAHSLDGLEDMKYGVNVGRKAGLTKEMTLNAMSSEAISQYFLQRKKRKGL